MCECLLVAGFGGGAVHCPHLHHLHLHHRRLHVPLQITLRPLVIQLMCMLCTLRTLSAGKQFADVCVVICLASLLCC